MVNRPLQDMLDVLDSEALKGLEVAENYRQSGVLVHEKMKVCQQRYVMMGKSLK